MSLKSCVFLLIFLLPNLIAKGPSIWMLGCGCQGIYMPQRTSTTHPRTSLCWRAPIERRSIANRHGLCLHVRPLSMSNACPQDFRPLDRLFWWLIGAMTYDGLATSLLWCSPIIVVARRAVNHRSTCHCGPEIGNNPLESRTKTAICDFSAITELLRWKLWLCDAAFIRQIEKSCYKINSAQLAVIFNKTYYLYIKIQCSCWLVGTLVGLSGFHVPTGRRIRTVYMSKEPSRPRN